MANQLVQRLAAQLFEGPLAALVRKARLYQNNAYFEAPITDRVAALLSAVDEGKTLTSDQRLALATFVAYVDAGEA